ncbi:WSC domain-containing protein, partial [Myxococcota bacterium]|nr:WSC domain-containing protein [Myxococcota bacterium]
MKTILISFLTVFIGHISLAQAQHYLGCYKDQPERDLTGHFMSANRLTTEQCVAECRSKGFKYAGTQYANQCYCGNSYGKTGKATNCDAKCA